MDAFQTTFSRMIHQVSWVRLTIYVRNLSIEYSELCDSCDFITEYRGALY